MRRIGGHRVGVAQGDVVLFSDFEVEGPMWAGEGARLSRAWVPFEEPFAAVPVVQVSLTMWDVWNGANSRGDVRAEEVAEAGFAIAFRTWGDTRVARVRVGWLAVGPLRDEEDWEVG